MQYLTNINKDGVTPWKFETSKSYLDLSLDKREIKFSISSSRFNESSTSSSGLSCSARRRQALANLQSMCSRATTTISGRANFTVRTFCQLFSNKVSIQLPVFFSFLCGYNDGAFPNVKKGDACTAFSVVWWPIKRKNCAVPYPWHSQWKTWVRSFSKED